MLTLLFVLFAFLGFTQTSPRYIVFYKPYTDSEETNLYKDTLVKFDYNTQYKNVKNANVNADVENAMEHNDLRIVSISGYTYLYPGLEGGYRRNKDGSKTFIFLSDKYSEYLATHSFKVIMGTSDAMMEGNPPLQSVAYDYAKKYNTLLLLKMKRLLPAKITTNKKTAQ